jgi:hypothetical protein
MWVPQNWKTKIEAVPQNLRFNCWNLGAALRQEPSSVSNFSSKVSSQLTKYQLFSFFWNQIRDVNGYLGALVEMCVSVFFSYKI